MSYKEVYALNNPHLYPKIYKPPSPRCPTQETVREGKIGLDVIKIYT